MDSHATMKQILLLGDCLLVHNNSICQTDHTDILHSADSELRNINLIVLRIRERCRKQVLIVLDTLSHDSELFLGIQILELAVSAENTHWYNRLTVLTVTYVFDRAVFSRTKAIDVRAYWG